MIKVAPLPSEILSRKRPRGLWKGRPSTPPGRLIAVSDKSFKLTAMARKLPHEIDDSDTDDNDELNPQRSAPRFRLKKRRRLSDSSLSDEAGFPWTTSSRNSPLPTPPPADERELEMVQRQLIDERPFENISIDSEKTSCDYDDWQKLKGLFGKASEQYENNNTSEALGLIRAVIHESHRFLTYYHDPSILFTHTFTQFTPHTPATLTPTDERITRDWANDRPPNTRKPSQDTRSRPAEQPTAFHAILGTSLFMLGNLISQNDFLAEECVPSSPIPYWLAALDVFETGENLPSRVNVRTSDAREDWRMAIAWGRTIVRLAEETLSRYVKSKTPSHSSTSSGEKLPPSPPPIPLESDSKWPPGSPFASIASRCPPLTRRMSLRLASSSALLILARDQFSRGIFHMPHPKYTPPNRVPTTTSAIRNKTIDGTGPEVLMFSREKEYLTIASEVLSVAERLESPEERKEWALWCDSLLNFLNLEAQGGKWIGPISSVRGRCWMIVGQAGMEELSIPINVFVGELDIQGGEEVEECRDALKKAISFFERAGTITPTEELQSLLAGSLLALSNLTQELHSRSELFARSQLERSIKPKDRSDPQSLKAIPLASEPLKMDESL